MYWIREPTDNWRGLLSESNFFCIVYNRFVPYTIGSEMDIWPLLCFPIFGGRIGEICRQCSYDRADSQLFSCMHIGFVSLEECIESEECAKCQYLHGFCDEK